MKTTQAIFMLLALYVMFCIGCVDERDGSVWYDGRDSSANVTKRLPADPSRDVPHKNIDIPDEGGTSSQTESGDDEVTEEYATDLRLTAGCEVDPPEMVVANNHQQVSLCERILATPMMDQDGDFFEVAAKFSWTVSSKTDLQIHCLNGPDDNLCWPLSQEDIFDNPNGLEPSALVTACAINVCPNPKPQDCKDAICKSVTVKVAVNIEGPWTLMGATLDPETHASITQSGRTFEDQEIGVQDGSVNGTGVYFEYGDYAYYGAVTEGSQTMCGYVIDFITSNFTGELWAVREL